MYDLKLYPNFTVVGIKDKIVFLSTDGSVLHEIVITQNRPSDSGNAKEGENGNVSQPAYVVTLEYCLVSKVFTVSASDKSLQCFQLIENDGKLLSTPLGVRLQTARTIVCMKFAPKHTVLLGCDKSDCYEYDPTGKLNKHPKWILGHMSQILDLAVSEDERYIVTCDRDEKIKVTSYPDCHNTVGYCLGHREYVAGLNVISPQKLLSVSGDKTLRLWDYTEGKETFNHTLEDPAVGVTLRRMNDGRGTLCAVRSYVQNKIEVAHINLDDPLKQCVSLDAILVDDCSSILHATLNETLELILLAIDKESSRLQILVYTFDSDKRRFGECADHVIKKSLQNYFAESTIDEVKDYSTLFKNSIDNLSDYFERKKQKIGIKKVK